MHFNESELEGVFNENDDDPFYKFESNNDFMRAVQHFSPKNNFEKQLVKGVLYRYGETQLPDIPETNSTVLSQDHSFESFGIVNVVTK